MRALSVHDNSWFFRVFNQENGKISGNFINESCNKLCSFIFCEWNIGLVNVFFSVRITVHKFRNRNLFSCYQIVVNFTLRKSFLLRVPHECGMLVWHLLWPKYYYVLNFGVTKFHHYCYPSESGIGPSNSTENKNWWIKKVTVPLNLISQHN